MNDVMGIVYTSKDNLNLRELTTNRAVAALPVAGRYRIIDFTLSNLVNSGVRNVGVIVQKNYHSLMDHLGSGKEWDLHTRNNGLFIQPPFLTRENAGEYTGIIEALRANFDYLRRSRQQYVIVTNSNYVCNTSFEPMIWSSPVPPTATTAISRSARTRPSRTSRSIRTQPTTRTSTWTASSSSARC